MLASSTAHLSLSISPSLLSTSCSSRLLLSSSLAQASTLAARYYLKYRVVYFSVSPGGQLLLLSLVLGQLGLVVLEQLRTGR